MHLWPSPQPPPRTLTPTWSLSLSGNWGKIKIGSSTQKDAAFHVLYGSLPASPGIRARGPFGRKLSRGGGLGLLCCSPVSRGTLGP